MEKEESLQQKNKISHLLNFYAAEDKKFKKIF